MSSLSNYPPGVTGREPYFDAPPEQHRWIKKWELTCCKKCGVVKRKDRKNGPCPGVVKVKLRGAS